MKKSGFTLVELLIVISIMSILTVITVSQFQSAKRKANDAERKGNLDALSKALQMYFADYGEFPEYINGFRTSGSWCPSNANCEFRDAGGYVYMKVLPNEKNSSYPPFCYVPAADRKSFALFAMLENKDDKDCRMVGNNGLYSGCGGVNNYCFYMLSPNARMNDTNNGPST